MARKPKKVVPEYCSNCMYGLQNNETSTICRRYPPTITKVEGESITAHFPLVTFNNWCGEWKEKVGWDQ